MAVAPPTTLNAKDVLYPKRSSSLIDENGVADVKLLGAKFARVDYHKVEGGEGDDNPAEVGLFFVAANLINASTIKNQLILTKSPMSYLYYPTADDGGREAVEEREGDGGTTVLNIAVCSTELLSLN